MLSHGYHGVMEAVSKRWRDVMRSEEYSNFKAREGRSGDWLFVLTEMASDQWIAYDPEADRWHPISLDPRSHLYRLCLRVCCVCVDNKFFLMGGKYRRRDPTDTLASVSNQVLQFDLFKKEWSTASSMRTARSDFACCVMEGKTYVAGGCNSDYPRGMNLAEVYDPLTDQWEDLPPMPLPMDDCAGIAYEGKFRVIKVYAHVTDLHCTQVFDPLSRSWYMKREGWPSSKPNQVAVTDDQVYAIDELDGNKLERKDAEDDEWHVLGEVPPLFDPADSQLHEALDYGLAALGHELYVIGGKNIATEDPEDVLVDHLDRVRVCDPRCSPLIWRETRPMCLNAAGSILGWASSNSNGNTSCFSRIQVSKQPLGKAFVEEHSSRSRLCSTSSPSSSWYCDHLKLSFQLLHWVGSLCSMIKSISYFCYSDFSAVICGFVSRLALG